MNLAGFSKSVLGSVDRPSVTNSSQCDGSIELIDRVYHSEVADSKRPRSFQLPSQVLSGVGIASQFFNHLQNASNAFPV